MLALTAALLNTGVIGGLHSWYGTENTSEFDRSKADKLILPDTSNSSHIIGSHIVHVVPPTIIKLNPNKTNFCISPSYQPTLSIPFTIKGTPPWSVDYIKVGFDGTIERFENVSIAPPSGSKAGRQMGTFDIPVTEPGVYQITAVRESNGVKGRIIPSVAEVSLCPDARWMLTEDGGERTVDRCVDGNYHFEVELVGAPPLRATYSRRVGKDEVFITVDTSEMQDVDDATAQTFQAAEELDAELKARVMEGRPRSFRVPSDIKLESSGPHFFKILSVADARNNTVIFDESGLQTRHFGNVIRSDRSSPDSFIIDSHPHPSAHFGKCDSIKLRVGSEYETEARLPVYLDGSGPWTVVLGRADTVDEYEQGISKDEFTLDKWEHKGVEIPVAKHGVYFLKSVSDVYCPGKVELPKTCLIQQSLPPTIKVSAEPIEQSCVGAIGALVNVSLTGEPPFWIEYDEIYGNVRVGRTAHLTKLRDTLSFKPSLPGTYIYEFKMVGDSVYTRGIPIEDVKITQIIHPQSVAWFTNAEKRIKCTKDTVDLNINVAGSGPWTITYEIIFESTKTQYVLDNVVENSFDISVPPLELPGTYVVGLINITDANGCSWPVESNDVNIEVLAIRPIAYFTCPKTVPLLEGSASYLPLSLSGKPPFSIKYFKHGNPSNLLEVSNIADKDKLTVFEPGTYEIAEFHDAYCAGIVGTPSECSVKTIARPELEIPKKEFFEKKDQRLLRKSICEGTEDVMDIIMTGKAPFNVRYDIDRVRESQRLEHVSSADEQVRGKLGRIPLLTKEPGKYVYTFLSVTDDNYKSAHSQQPLYTLEQKVMRRPDAVFVDDRERVFQCLGDSPDDGIKISLKGLPPFDLILELKHESHPRETIRLTNITETSYNFKPPTLSTTGKYNIQLVSLQDASGCEKTFDRDSKVTSISVQVSDVARIASLNPESVCVGDILTYTLQGTPPFTVYYNFNGVEQEKVQIMDPLLSLYAAEAGSVTINRVCNQMQCCTEPTNLTHVVHRLPSAIVDGGHDLIEDIREGDEATISVEFEGEPPFSFTYSRKDLTLPKGQKSRAEESFTISNIETNQGDAK
ncbi:hypothetical protein HDV05_007891 [Chytridiales sp. JEL 0842]|nr:hypothetical protein HDV05_007891 [Chytridiales sp. JEL 0842]